MTTPSPLTPGQQRLRPEFFSAPRATICAQLAEMNPPIRYHEILPFWQADLEKRQTLQECVCGIL